MTSQTRPDIAFQTSMIGGNIKKCTVGDVLMYNKVIRQLRAEHLPIRLLPLGDRDEYLARY